MNIFGYEIGRKDSLKLPVISDRAISVDFRDQGTTIRPELKGVSVPEAKRPANIPPVKPVTLQYSTSGSTRGEFIESEYDLSEIGRVEDTESYVAQAFIKKIGLLFKEGFEFVGPNPTTIQYVEERFQQIARASGIPADELLRSIGAGLIKKSNAFLIKVRKESASGGRSRVLPGSKKKLEPIAAYFVAPAETMQVDADMFGNIRRWKQRMPNGNFQYFAKEDVVHFYFNKKEGLFFGTPTLVPVIDDIRALRKIEENVELLIYQHLFPLFHYRVGSDQMPAGLNENGESEIDVAEQAIRYMPSEGGIVTSHRHEIRLIGAESRSLRADSYLEHFKKRVLSGLGVSAVDMGEGECYSDDTQTLTESGWKFHWAIDHEKEKIGTYNPFSKKIEFHIANYKYEQPYFGKMVKIENNFMNLMVTPNHDMWVFSRKDKRWMKMTAQQLVDGKAGRELVFLETVPFWDTEPTIPFPKGDVRDVATLAGYVASLGSAKDKSIYIKKRRRVGLEPICESLLSLSIPWTITSDGRDTFVKIDEKSLDGYLLNFLDRNGLKLAEEFPLSARKLFVQTYADGFFRIKKAREGLDKNNSREYFSRMKHKLDVDILQKLIISAGYTAYVNRVVDKKGGEHFTIRVNLKEKSKSRRMAYLKRDVSVVDYQGIIYCYNVPNHLFVTRRKNKVTIQGNTANRATSDNMSTNLVDSVKDIQRTLESQLNSFVISELLQESTFGSDVLNKENLVKIQFKEIDLDHQIKKNAHAADQFNKNIISLDEARKMSNLQPFSIPTAEEVENDPDVASKYPEWHRTQFKLITEPTILMQSIDEPYAAAAKALAASNVSATTEKQRLEAAQEKEAAEERKQSQKPQKKEVPKEVIAKDSLLIPKFSALESDVSQMVQKNAYDFDSFRQLAYMTQGSMIREMRSMAMAAFASGYSSVNRNSESQIDATIRSRNKIQSRVEFYVNRLIRDTINSMKRQKIENLSEGDRIQKVTAVFDSLRFRNRFIEDVEIRKAYNLGVIEAARDRGFTKWKINVQDDACETCKEASQEVFKIAETSIDDLPPLHASARAQVEVFE